MPGWTEQVKDLVTSAALVLGIIGAGWKWFFSEWLRRRSDIPSLAGDVTAKVSTFSPEQAMLQINSEWTNNGNFPVYLDPKELEISIYAIKTDSEVGFISFDRPGPKVGSLYPRKTWGEYFFEPKTKSIIQSVAIVEKGRSYLIKVSFGLDEKRHGSLGDNLWTYERCMVVHIPAQ